MLTKRKIQWIITLMSGAAIGLLVFQWFWISNVLKLQNEQFDLKITDGLQEVVRKLEKQEIIYLSRQQAQAEAQKRNIEALGKPRITRNNPRSAPQHYSESAIFPDKMGNPSDIFVPNTKSMTEGQHSSINNFLRNRFHANPQLETLLQEHAAQQQALDEWFDGFENRFGSSVLPRFPKLTWDTTQQAYFIVAPATVSLPPNRQTTKQKNSTNPKTELLKDIFKDILFGNRPIEDRISQAVLDTLLHDAFQERGISIPFEYEIENNRQSPVISSVAYQSKKVPQELFKATLFPNEISNRPSYLSVYFPDRQQFIFKNIWFSLITSGLLLLVLMACFYMAVSTILKQKKLSDIKNDFINNMTHELKTPISTVALAVDMATQQKDTSKLSRYLNIIKTENQRLGGQVEKVLQMALLDRGQTKLSLSEIHVHDLIEKVLDTIGVQIEQKQGSVELRLEAENDLIKADEAHITNIFHNLIDNANKYSPENPEIIVATQNIPNGLKISIKDKGLGINKEQQSRIFEQFYRVPTGNLHDVKGFGLGLSYVKKIVEAHAGTITVESKLGQGSTFEITLPTSLTTQN